MLCMQIFFFFLCVHKPAGEGVPYPTSVIKGDWIKSIIYIQSEQFRLMKSLSVCEKSVCVCVCVCVPVGNPHG